MPFSHVSIKPIDKRKHKNIWEYLLDESNSEIYNIKELLWIFFQSLILQEKRTMAIHTEVLLVWMNWLNLPVGIIARFPPEH